MVQDSDKSLKLDAAELMRISAECKAALIYKIENGNEDEKISAVNSLNKLFPNYVQFGANKSEAVSEALTRQLYTPLPVSNTPVSEQKQKLAIEAVSAAVLIVSTLVEYNDPRVQKLTSNYQAQVTVYERYIKSQLAGTDGSNMLDKVILAMLFSKATGSIRAKLEEFFEDHNLKLNEQLQAVVSVIDQASKDAVVDYFTELFVFLVEVVDINRENMIKLVDAITEIINNTDIPSNTPEIGNNPATQ